MLLGPNLRIYAGDAAYGLLSGFGPTSLNHTNRTTLSSLRRN